MEFSSFHVLSCSLSDPHDGNNPTIVTLAIQALHFWPNFLKPNSTSSLFRWRFTEVILLARCCRASLLLDLVDTAFSKLFNVQLNNPVVCDKKWSITKSLQIYHIFIYYKGVWIG